MINTNLLNKLIEEKTRGTGIYVIEVSINPNNQIKIILDSDTVVTIKDCAEINRFVGSNMVEENENFSLEVSSAGIDQPLKIFRQYKKYIGKEIEVIKTNGVKKKGTLLAVDEIGIELREKNNTAKIQEVGIRLPFIEIKETKAKITF